MLKLIKHEIKQVWSYLALITLATVVITVVQRFIFSNGDNMQRGTFANEISAPLLFFILFIFGTVVFFTLVSRYHKSMYGDEGYLTAVLPVPLWKVVTAKLIVATIFTWFAIVVVFLCIMSLVKTDTSLFMVGVNTVFSAIWDLFTQFPFQMVMFALDLALMPMLLYADIYLSLAIGQLSNQNKLLASIIALITIWVAKQGVQYLLITIGLANYFSVTSANIDTPSSTVLVVFTIIQIAISLLASIYLSKNRLNLS